MKEEGSRLPSRLSPSRAQDFIDCPKKFYYKTIEGLIDPPNIHTARGTVAHTALERLFDHPREERTEETAVAYVAPGWKELIEPNLDSIEDQYLKDRAAADAKRYQEQVAEGKIDVDELLETAEKMVRNYFKMEDPQAFDPEGRELRLAAEAAGVPVHGIIDRLDKVESADGETRWYISDYKTAGKIPSDRWMHGKFFAMRVYAVLIEEQMGVQVTGLRLIYLKGAKPEAIKYEPVTQASLSATRKQLKALWQAMKDAERRDMWPTKTGPLCNWCAFMDICPAWAQELEGVEGADPKAGNIRTKGTARTSSKKRTGAKTTSRNTSPAQTGATTITRRPARGTYHAEQGKSSDSAAGGGAAALRTYDPSAAKRNPDDPLSQEHAHWGGPDDQAADF